MKIPIQQLSAIPPLRTLLNELGPLFLGLGQLIIVELLQVYIGAIFIRSVRIVPEEQQEVAKSFLKGRNWN